MPDWVINYPDAQVSGVAALPLITDTKANGQRGRNGPKADLTI